VNPLPLLASKRAVLWIQSPIEIPPDSAPQPDLALLRWRDDCYRLALPRPPDVLLVLEVADSTLARDRSKLDAYARAGIQEAWLIDAHGKAMIVARDPVPGGYRTLVEATGAISPLDFPDLRLDLAALFA
jgi:Uma2 family endonuclease